MSEDPPLLGPKVRLLTLYSRAGCCLCDEGYDKVARLARRLGLALKKIDIAGDLSLEARHGTRIPVVELDGDELGWGRVSEKRLELILKQRLGLENAQDSVEPLDQVRRRK